MANEMTVHKAASAVSWSEEAKGAQMLFRSGLCPAAIKTPEAALFVILAGRDLGLSAVASLRNINVIQGKVEVAADMQLALFHREGGSSKWLEITAKRAALQLTAPWMDAPHVSEFTMEDAKRAQLGGTNWQKYPKAMLRSRAITQGLKDIGYDSTAGVYAPGEIGGPEAVIEAEVEEVAGEVVATPVADAIDHITQAMTLEDAMNVEMPVGNSKGKVLDVLDDDTLAKAYDYFVNRPEYGVVTHAIALVRQARLDGELAPPKAAKAKKAKKGQDYGDTKDYAGIPVGLQEPDGRDRFADPTELETD